MTVLEKLIYDLDTDDYQDTTFLAQDLEAQSMLKVADWLQEMQEVRDAEWDELAMRLG